VSAITGCSVRHDRNAQQGIQSGIVEPLADVSARREHQTLGRLRHRRELIERLAALLRGSSSPQDDQVWREAAQSRREEIEMILGLGKHEAWSAQPRGSAM
jgi:hypothetical protein